VIRPRPTQTADEAHPEPRAERPRWALVKVLSPLHCHRRHDGQSCQAGEDGEHHPRGIVIAVTVIAMLWTQRATAYFNAAHA
jgi:hypothetical protein